MKFEDVMGRVIGARFAPDFASALHKASSMELTMPRDSVRVPLLADVAIIHNKGLAAFIINTKIHTDGDYIGGRQLFSTRQIKTASDAAALVEYVFDYMKRDFWEKIANKELDNILGQPNEAI